MFPIFFFRRSARPARLRSALPLFVLSGAGAALLSLPALAWRGRAETGSAAAPLNAVSHWLNGGSALRRDEADLRHTLLGGVVHGASAFLWAGLYASMNCRHAVRHDAARLARTAAAVTIIAAVTDFKLVPERFTPGFEHRLSRPSLILTYALFGSGLLLGGWAATRR